MKPRAASADAYTRIRRIGRMARRVGGAASSSTPATARFWLGQQIWADRCRRDRGATSRKHRHPLFPGTLLLPGAGCSRFRAGQYHPPKSDQPCPLDALRFSHANRLLPRSPQPLRLDIRNEFKIGFTIKRTIMEHASSLVARRRQYLYGSFLSEHMGRVA